MNEAQPAPSPALRAANERLLALRAQLERQSDRSAAVQAETAVADPSGPQEPPAPLPAHLGWDSPAVTTAVRTRQTEPETATSTSSVQATSTACAEPVEVLSAGCWQAPHVQTPAMPPRQPTQTQLPTVHLCPTPSRSTPAWPWPCCGKKKWPLAASGCSCAC
jgi:hypothetical protein